MSISISLYNFSKRENSTKIPTGGFVVDCVLKSDTSIYNPSFLLNLQSPLNYNYLKWDDRYYYIDDVIYTSNKHVELQCRIDVLATWKTEIGKVSAYTRYASGGYDIGIPDNRLSSNPEVIRKTSSSYPFVGAETRYVTGVLLNGFSDVVCLTYSDVSILTRAIMSSAYGELFTDISKGVSKILTDTSKCITSCYVNPVCYVNNENSYSPILAGGYSVEGVSFNPPIRNKKITVSLEIPWAFDLHDFRNRSMFTTLEMYLPGYGVVNLNPDNFFGRTSIKVEITVDSGGGEITYYIEGLTKCTCNVLCAVQISTTSTGNMVSAVGNTIGAIGSAMSGNPLGVGAGLFGAIVSSLETSPGSVGGVGGQANFNANKNIVLTVVAHDTNVEPSTLANNYGRPCNKVKQISAGYNECTNASVDCNAPRSIKEQINNYMNGGFYYE